MTDVKMAVIQNIRKHMADFGIGEVELLERIRVVADLEQFNAQEDESVWNQKKGRAPTVTEVYFDEVWCCDLYETDSHEKLVNKFFKGFERGYNRKKIRLNRFLAKLEDEQISSDEKDAQDRLKNTLKNLPSQTPEEKMAKEIVSEIAQEEHEKSATL